MDIITIVLLVILLLILAIIFSSAFIFLDLMSYTARGAKSITSSRSVIGNALVVYNPGISRMAKNTANDIANKLKSKGYNVNLAGIKSKTASNTIGYKIVIVGGPMYMGKATKSIENYLKNLKLQKDVKLGIFTTTGTDQFNNNDFQSLKKQVEMLMVDIPLDKVTIKLIRSGNESVKDNEDLVSDIIQ
jgi:menaquinone-dependent protoporphyrinogen IX oxidase